MYSVRKNTTRHGNTYFNLLIFILCFTGIIIWKFGSDYLVIFLASAMFHLIIEGSLTLSGLRKGTIYLHGRKLPPAANVALRALVDGPGLCVPAFFVADQFMAGRYALAIVGSVVVVGIVSLYMGLADRRDLRRLGPGEAPLVSRRAMTKPGGVMLLTLINTGNLIALFLIPQPYRAHAFVFLIAYCVLVLLFYVINYNLGVRMIELYDHERGAYTKPGPLFQAAALTYDSAYEMGLFMTPVYWVTFYLGFFHYSMLA